MPKFTCEIDTDAKTAVFMIDGKEIDAHEFTLSKYTCWYTEMPDPNVSVSYCTRDKKTMDKNCKCIYFDKGSITETETNRSVAKDVNKSIAAIKSIDTLDKVLAKYKIN